MEEVQKHLYVLIHAGGGGTRLWPQSREKSPKQFIRLFGGKTLYQLTLERARKMVPISHIIVTTSSKYTAEIKRESKNLPAENIISEPIRRDSAMAYGLGALYVHKRDPEAVVINLASDHLVSPIDVYVKEMMQAAALAYTYGKVIVMGIKPTYPHTGLGHIKAVKEFKNTHKNNILVGEKFVEKPPLPLAKRYTESGKYFWNLNMFVWKTSLILDLLKVHAPKTYSMFPKLLEAIGTEKENELIQLTFQMAPSISVEFAVTNKLSNFILYHVSFGWSDVGDWNVVWQHLPKDQVGNVIQGTKGVGKYIGINSKNNLLFLDKKIVATVGLEDMLIVDTPDALLICPKDHAQGVKQVVQALKDNNLTEYL